MREYEKHQAANGNPPSHAFAKELMAGIAAAEVGSVLYHTACCLVPPANECLVCISDSRLCTFNPLPIS